MRISLRIFIALLAAGLCQCGTTLAPAAVPLVSNDRVEVIFSDGNTTMSLRNASSTTAEAAYGPSSNLTLKIASDPDLSALLEGLSSSGFFTNSTPVPGSQARATLTVRRNGRSYVRSRLPFAMSSKEDIENFNQCVWLFRYMFDQTDSYHTGSTADFDTQTQRLLEQARQAAQRGRK